MLLIFKSERTAITDASGNPVLGNDGTLRMHPVVDPLEAMVAIAPTVACECAPTVKFCKDGWHQLTLGQELAYRNRPLGQTLIDRLASDAPLEPTLRATGDLTDTTTVTSDVCHAGLEITISSSCGDLTINDFPEHRQFGNGITCGRRVICWRNGESRILHINIVCLPIGTVLSAAQYNTIKGIMEASQ